MKNQESQYERTNEESTGETVDQEQTSKKQLLTKRVVRTFIPVRSDVHAGSVGCGRSR